MKKLIFILALMALCFANYGQDYQYQDYRWEKKPRRAALSIQEDSQSYVVLKEHLCNEYVYEKDNLFLYRFFHKKVRLNDNAAIERFNQVQISLDNVIEIVDIMARTISKDGKIIEVDKNNIKEVENLENQGGYKIFAIEGLEKGCDLEYFYILKKDIGYCECNQYIFQEDAIVKNAMFELISPKNLVFLAKGYNGFPTPLPDTLYDGRRILKASMDSIPALDEETYSVYIASLMRIEYKFRNNEYVKKSEVLTWADFAKQIYDVLYSEDEKTDKKIEKMLSGLKLKNLGEEEKIKKIEVYLKTKFSVKEDPSAKNISDFDFIFKKSYTDDLGMMKLFCRFLKVAGIEHQPGSTTDRFRSKFDKDFMTWNYLDNYVIYFPKYSKFLAPTEITSRYGLLPYKWVNNYGLFIKPVTVGDLASGVPVTRMIPAPSWEITYRKEDIDVTFDNEFNQADIKLMYRDAGYISLQPYYELLSKESQDDILDESMKTIGKDAEIVTKAVENTDINLSPTDTPFVTKGEITIKSIIERAGDNILFKVGDLIGRQTEMYAEKDRMLDIEVEYAHHYIRHITFIVPDGYKVEGLDKLKINIVHQNNSIGFISDYKVEGNKVIITCNEYYKEVFYPKSAINEFRQVINAAADFNKIMLVFKKI